MKALPLLIAVLLLPLFLWWGERHYQHELRAPLEEAIHQALAAPDFSRVEAGLTYFDAALDGEVATPLLRFDAERLVGAIEGVRMRPENNHLVIPGYYILDRRNDALLFSGLLPAEGKPALLRLKSSLGGEIEELSYHSHVVLPFALDEPQLLLLLQEFFALPGDRRFSYRDGVVRLQGSATEEMESGWQQRLAALASDRELALEEDLQLYPSLQHLPGYRTEAQLNGEEYLRVTRALPDLAIYFDAASTEPADAERKKIARLAELIATVPAPGRFVIGGHADSSGDAEINRRLSRQRGERVRDLLVEAGVDAGRLEVVSFGASVAPQGDAPEALDDEQRNRLSRRVEILLK